MLRGAGLARGVMVLVLTAGASLPIGGAVASGAAAAPARSDPSTLALASADRALASHRSAVAAADGDAYVVHRSRIDRDGAAHVRYTRRYHGLP